MAKLYEMCNDVNSEDLILDKEEMSVEEQNALLASVSKQITEEREMTKSGKKRKKVFKIVGWAATAAAVAILVLPNASPKVAYAMSQVPVLKNVIQVVVIRDYSYAEAQYEADVEQGSVVIETEDHVDYMMVVDEVTDETEVSVAIINTDIDAMTQELIEDFEADVATDENISYWLDEEIEPEMNFVQIKENQNFYLNEQGAIVICFDEYEVAPGYMGLVEFTIEMDVLTDIIK